MNSRWKQYLLYASLIILGGGLIFILIETVRAKNTGFETKTLWDWMQLLLVPLLLAGGVFFLNRSEKEIERQRAEGRAKIEIQRAEDRAKLEREIATDRQQEAALQSYLDRMSDLILKEKLITLPEEEKQIGVSEVARTRTLAVLRRLEPKRKRIVMLFLYDASLISKVNPLIDLADADFSGADLEGVYLGNVNFNGVDFRGAKLQYANLKGCSLYLAKFHGAQLMNAILNSASLRDALFIGANLLGVDFKHAEIDGANFASSNLELAQVTDEQLSRVWSLKGAIMPDGTKHE